MRSKTIPVLFALLIIPTSLSLVYAQPQTGDTKINRVMVGEALVGDVNEVAHIDLLLGPRGSAAETAFWPVG